MSEKSKVVFMFDVDDTLYDNDQYSVFLKEQLVINFGEEARDRFVRIYEGLRHEHGYADYFGALQRFRLEYITHPNLVAFSIFIQNYPYADWVCFASLEVLKYVEQWGPAVILSDGDIVHQPRKVDKTGIYAAVEGRVLIYIHKELMLEDVANRYPAEHYVMVDDKLRILHEIKQRWGDKVTTIHCKTGHYAHDPKHLAYPPADHEILNIGALLDYDFPNLIPTLK